MANGAAGQEPVPLAGYPDPSDATIAFVDRITTHRSEIVQAKIDAVHTEIVHSTGAHRDLVNAQIAGLRGELLGAVDVNRTRLDAMDTAAEVLAKTVAQIPTALQQAAHEINNTMALRFQAVEDHFSLIDKATERQRHDAELAASALARTQERATSSLATANADAIKRSDEHTAEKIKKNEESQLAGQKALADKIEVADQRANRMEQAISAIQVAAVTTRDTRTDARSVQGLGLYAIIVVLTLVATIAAIYGIVKP
jgi:cobalamin biosynthesis Mg chelatase CobN